MPTMGSKRSDGAKRLQRDFRFPAHAPGEDGQIEARGEAIEQAVARHPPLAQDQAVVPLPWNRPWK
jgi:hypothetical protein